MEMRAMCPEMEVMMMVAPIVPMWEEMDQILEEMDPILEVEAVAVAVAPMMMMG